MIEETILAIGQEVYRAIRLKDVESLSGYLGDDFVQRGPDGSESNKEEFLRAISEMPVEVVSVSGEHEKVNVYGQVAVMTGVQRAEWRQGDEAKGISSVAFTDVFELRNGKWLMVLAYGIDIES
jgi:hypothetical protein